MKRILPILFLLALLCGCAAPKPEEQPQESTTQPTEPPVVNTYVADSDIEKQTSAANGSIGFAVAIFMVKESLYCKSRASIKIRKFTAT